MRKWAPLFLVLSLIMVCCSPEDGQDGAIGPRGEQGEQGEDGEQGEPGTANVIYSEWTTLDFGEPPINETIVYDFIMTDVVTQQIKDNGLVMVFGRSIIGSAYRYFSLPYTRFQVSQYYEFELSENHDDILVWLRSTDGGPIGQAYLNEFRYVIVPGGIPAKGESYKDYRKMSYKEIVEHFNIPE